MVGAAGTADLTGKAADLTWMLDMPGTPGTAEYIAWKLAHGTAVLDY